MAHAPHVHKMNALVPPYASTANGRRAAALAAHPPPAELARIAEAIGPAATLALIESCGGTRITLPKRHPDDLNQGHQLARLIGLAPARALLAVLGSGDFKVPLARHWRVRIYRHEGESYSGIARRLGITEKAVHGHLQAARLTTAQPSLF